MPDQVVTQDDLGILTASLADNKYFLGRRYAEWCTAAPTLESAVAAAAMAQDEIGHARSLYPLLEDIVGDSPEVRAETRRGFTNVDFLNRPFDGWTDFVAANFLFDTALAVLLEAARDSSVGALSQRARRMVEEERLHWLHGEGWTKRLAEKGPAVKRRLEESLAPVAVQSLEWFGVAGPSLVDDGVLSAEADELRERYRQRVDPVLRAARLQPL